MKDSLLLEHMAIYRLPKTSQKDLTRLVRWLCEPDNGGDFLRDPEDLVFHLKTKDHVTLSSYGEEDNLFAKFIRNVIVENFARSRLGRWMRVGNPFSDLAIRQESSHDD